MFKLFRKVFLPRSRYISIINMNDVYIQTMADVVNVLGGELIPTKRKHFDKRVYLLDFKGDVMASGANGLAQEITVVLASADPKLDEVIIKVESPGGAVHSYGYAASQIMRLKAAGLKTTVLVDRVAASGGYMMACVADKIIAAPFAILGSIGVVAEFPNFAKLISDLGIEYRQYTAGEYKRTVGTFTPITEAAENKFKENLHETFKLFKDHILANRPTVDLDKVATGEHWYGTQAFDLNLIDEIGTSDEVLLNKMKDSEVLKVSFIADKTWSQRLQGGIVSLFDKLYCFAATKLTYQRF